MKNPWFKLYAADLMTDHDFDRLPLEAQAILLRMWCVCWLEGSIPGDPEDLARKCKVKISSMQLHVQSLMQFFMQTDRGTFISERMEREKQRCSSVSDVRSGAAKKRWNKGLNANAYANDHAKPHAKPDAIADAVRGQIQKSEVQILKPSETIVSGGDAPAQSDPRHAPIRKLIQDLHLQVAEQKCQWDGSEGKALDRLLSANPSWTEEQIESMVRNRFESDLPTERPRVWLPRLDDFAKGPLDRFKRVSDFVVRKGPCEKHPQSGRTEWGTCWGCYANKNTSQETSA